jgi:tetratricopeptide (TPR) repeat protein
MNRKCVWFVAVSLLVLSTSQAQDAKIAADNLEFSREFYSGVHVSAIAESAPSFGYQRYPDNGPERIQCDQGTFARKQRGKPWLRSEDWGESGRTVDPQVAQKLDGWVKLVEAAFDFEPSEIKLVKKFRQGIRVGWIFEARAANQKGAPVQLEFEKPLYDKNPNVLLHGFEGSLPIAGGKTVRSERVKFSFGYLIAASGFELSEAAWENLETPKELENKPIDLTKIDIGPKPNDAEGFLNRAGARAFNGDMNGAIADCTRAIELDPKSEPAVYKRGALKLQKGDNDGAIADLTRAIELSPNTADYYSDRGLAKLRKRDNDGAIVDFTRAIELDAKNAIAYRNRALAKNIKGDADGALADYNRAIELDPKNAGAFNSRGLIKKAKGDLDGAIADFNSAVELNDKLAIAYKNRSEAKQAKGDAVGAKEDLKRAGELDPELTQQP